jgi:hypothetical protein
VVRPLLLKHGIPCTFFVTTGVLDNRELLVFNKVALALEALHRAPPQEPKEVLSAMSAAAGTSFPTVAALGAWIRRAIRDPDSGGAALADELCARMEVDTEAFLRDERPYMTSDQVRQLAAEGFTIGGHTRFHWQLGRTRGHERVAHEIVESCRIAAELSGAEQVPFAFPYDASGVDREFLAVLLARNPQIGPLFGAHGLQPDEPFLVNRMLADAPPRVGRARSNLGGLIMGGYLEEMLSAETMTAHAIPAATILASAVAY